MAERDDSGGWRELNYARAPDRPPAHCIGAAGARASAERPVIILSGNSIDHALVAFGALYAGIPFCPVSAAYSLVSKDYGKLDYVMKLLTPGLVFVDNGDKFADALSVNGSRVEVVVPFGGVAGAPHDTRQIDGDAVASGPRCQASRDRP